MDLGQPLSSRDPVINFQTLVSNSNFMSHNKNPYIGSGGIRLNSNTNSLIAFNDPSGISNIGVSSTRVPQKNDTKGRLLLRRGSLPFLFILRHGDVLMPNISHQMMSHVRQPITTRSRLGGAAAEKIGSNDHLAAQSSSSSKFSWQQNNAMLPYYQNYNLSNPKGVAPDFLSKVLNYGAPQHIPNKSSAFAQHLQSTSSSLSSGANKKGVEVEVQTDPLPCLPPLEVIMRASDPEQLKHRHRKDKSQIKLLDEEFLKQQAWSHSKKVEIAAKFGLTLEQVKKWHWERTKKEKNKHIPKQRKKRTVKKKAPNNI